MRRPFWLCLAALLAGGATPAGTPPEWGRPVRPFHVVGPIYYVGTQGIAVYLIETRAGLILLDGGLEENAPLVERSIASLGFRLRDIKWLIATHAHYDHAAALAELKRHTGARFIASSADRLAYETGTPPSEVSYGIIRFPPVAVDRLLVNGRPIHMGGVSLTPVITPGHTPGCTSWTMRVRDLDKDLDVIFPCSLTVAGNKLVGNKGYPAIAVDFRTTFSHLRRLRADVVLPAHPEQADILGRAERRDAGETAAFEAPDLLPRLVEQAEAAFNAELAKQGGS